MQIVIHTAGVARDVDVNVQVPDATVADLLDALGQHTDGDAVGIVVDGRRLPGYLALAEAGLHDGAVVHLGDAGKPPSGSDGAGPALAVVGGLDTGRRIVLPHGRAVIGRDASCAVRLVSSTVSSRHCAVDVDPFGVVSLKDLGSRNGALVDGVTLTGRHELSPGQIVQLGAVQLTLVARDPHDRPALLGARRTAGGNTSFNRPPRSMRPAPGEPVPLPKPPREAPVRQPFSWIAVLAPLALAAVLVLVTGSFLYAMFALLSPVMLIGNWAEGRRQGKHTSRRETARFAADLDTFRTQLAARRGEATRALRAELPESSEVLRRASAPSVRLWERRLTDPDFLHLSAGTGSIDWRPVVANPHGERPAEVTRVVAEMSRLELVPALVDLADGGVVGITGPRAAGLALARSLVCQAAVHHGPADLRIAVLTEPEGVVAWEWVKWLPHAHDAAAGGGARLLAADAAAADALMHELFEAHRARPEAERNNRDGRPGGPVLFAVVDAVRLTEGRNAPVRALLRGAAGPVAGIVLAPTTDRLPAVCTTVVELLDADGTARLSRPPLGEVVDGLLIGGLDTGTARACALALARFEDPETAAVGASLPIRVDVTTLFDQDVFDPAVVEALWRSAGREGGHDPGVAAPIGVTEEGVLTLDLLRDGPHGLVGGTTGSGKSELLRSLVAALALRVSPAYLNFVLIDYKGGSAFDECARLPHTVGMVTDLDAQLGERALRCLEAELRHRERLLREAGADDLRAWLRLPDAAARPLPRLLVVIDEFATMAAELPDFMEALVGIAQRGRSLGVHLLLATQRPSGAVKDSIRANTNLRIALRMQDGADSTDVIGKPDAARIGRDQPGRAFVRLGPSEVVPIQTALVTGVSRRDGGRVDVAGFHFGRRAREAVAVAALEPEVSDLVRVVAAAREAFAAAGLPEPRRPWPEPLPAELSLDAVAPGLRALDAGRGAAGSRADATVLVALADDPDAQSQYPVGWRPADGNLLLFGLAGSGTTTTLISLALALVAGASADEVHLYALNFGAGALSVLAGLPHTGAVVTASEGERQRRLVRMLRAELDRRRELGPDCRAEPKIVLLLDGFSAFRAEYDEPAMQWVQEELTRIVSEGPGRRMFTVITADRTGAVPTALSATVSQKWLFRLADPYDYAMFGVKFRSPSSLPPGRCLMADKNQLVQVARPEPTPAHLVARIVAATRAPVRPPAPLGTLPTEVDPEELAGVARLGEQPWLLPVGIAEATLGPALLRIYPAEHVLIAGPARSGRSGVLCALACLLAEADRDLQLTVVAPRPSALRELRGLRGVAGVVTSADELPDELARVAGADRPQVVLVDDAEMLDDPSGAVEALIKRLRPDVHVIAAGRAELLRTAYGHWTQTVRRSGCGVLLRPDVDFDGDLLAVRLPRQAPVPVSTARGWLVNGGEAEFIQAVTIR